MRSIDFKIIFIIIVMIGAIYLRVDDLDVRPLHHDESIHATFSLNWYTNPTFNFYKYDPTYHGPFLYLFERCIFELYGVSVFTARLMPLIFGLALLALPFLFLPFISFWAALFASAAIAVSPHLAYYARFLAHDMPTIFFSTFFVAGLMHWRRLKDVAGQNVKAHLWLVGAAVCLGLLFSVKLISHLWLFILFSFVLLHMLIRWLRAPRQIPFKFTFNRGVFVALILALQLALLCYAIVQTALFQNPAGFLDGLYRTSIAHWWQQHAVERIKGPVWFHLRALTLLEWLILICVCCYCVNYLRKTLWGVVTVSLLAMLLLFTVPFPWLLEEKFPAWLCSALGILKIKKSADLFLFSMTFVFGILLTGKLLWEDKPFLAFLHYWVFASLSIYSYIGEKVPWLTTHIVFPGALLTGVALAEFFALNGATHFTLKSRAKAVAAYGLAILCVLELRLAYLVNKVTAGEPEDLLSQVHNHRDVTSILEYMRITAHMEGIEATKFPFAVIGKPVWAFYFYLLMDQHANFKIRTEDLKGDERIVVLGREEYDQLEKKLLAAKYKLAVMQNEGWWVPEYTTVSWGEWIKYAWTRNPTSDAGGTKMYVFYK